MGDGLEDLEKISSIVPKKNINLYTSGGTNTLTLWSYVILETVRRSKVARLV